MLELRAFLTIRVLELCIFNGPPFFGGCPETRFPQGSFTNLIRAGFTKIINTPPPPGDTAIVFFDQLYKNTVDSISAGLFPWKN